MESTDIYSYMDEIQEELDMGVFNESKATTWAKKLKELIKSHHGDDCVTSTTRLILKCVSFYIQYLFNIPFLKKNQEELFLISSKYVGMVKEILPSSLKCTFLVDNLAKIFMLTLIEDPRIPQYITKDVLKLLLDFIKLCKRQEVESILECLPSYMLYKLFDNVCVHGDYDLQSLKLEIIIRVYGQERINSELQSLVPKSQEASQSLAQINLDTFHKDVRKFLNILNKQYRYSGVFSIICEEIKLGEEILETQTWLDFNIHSSAISWYYNKSHLIPNVIKDDHCLITLFRSNINKIDIRDDRGLIFFISLNKSCICDCKEVQTMLEKSKEITITFELTEKSKMLIDEVLQKFMEFNNITEPDFAGMLSDEIYDLISPQKQSPVITCVDATSDHDSSPSLAPSIQSTSVTDTDLQIHSKNILYEEQISAEVEISQLQSLTQNTRWEEAVSQGRYTGRHERSQAFYSARDTNSIEGNTEYETAQSRERRIPVNQPDFISKMSIGSELTIDFQRNESDILEMRSSLGDNSKHKSAALFESQVLEEISNRRQAAQLSHINSNKETDETSSIGLNSNKEDSVKMNKKSSRSRPDRETKKNARSDVTLKTSSIKTKEDDQGNRDGSIKHTKKVISTESERKNDFPEKDKERSKGQTPLQTEEKKTHSETSKMSSTNAVGSSNENKHGFRKLHKKHHRNVGNEPAEIIKTKGNRVKERDENVNILKSNNISKVQQPIRIKEKTPISLMDINTETEKTRQKITRRSKKKSSTLEEGKEEDIPDNKDSSKKLNEKQDQNSENRPAKIVKTKEKTVKQHDQNLNVFDTSMVQGNIETKEKGIFKSLPRIKSGEKMTQGDVPTKSKKQNDFLEQNKVNLKTVTPMKTKEKKIQEKTLQKSSFKKRVDVPKSSDGFVTDFKKHDILKVPVLLTTTSDNILRSPTNVKSREETFRKFKNIKNYIEDNSDPELVTTAEEITHKENENDFNLNPPIKTKPYNTNVEENSGRQALVKGSKKFSRSPSIVSTTEEKLELEVSWKYTRTTEIIEEDSDIKDSDTENDKSSGKPVIEDIAIEESVKRSPLLTKTNRNTGKYEKMEIVSKTQTSTETQEGNTAKNLKHKDCRAILKERKSKKEILKAPAAINQNEMNDFSKTSKNKIGLRKIGKNDTQIKKSLKEVSKMRKSKLDIDENNREHLKLTTKRPKGLITRNRKLESVQTSSKMKEEKMKSKLLKGVNLGIKRDIIVKEKRGKKDEIKLADITNGGGNREIPKYSADQGMKLSAAEDNRSISSVETNPSTSTDSNDIGQPKEMAEVLFDNLCTTTSYSMTQDTITTITKKREEFQANDSDGSITENSNRTNKRLPELVVSLNNFTKKAVVSVEPKNDQITLADSSNKWNKDMYPVAEEQRDVTVSNHLGRLETIEKCHNATKTIKCKDDFNEIQVLHSEPGEFVRTSQIERYGTKTQSMNITEVEVQEVPNRFLDKATHFEGQSKISKVTTMPKESRMRRKLYSGIDTDDIWDAAVVPISATTVISDNETSTTLGRRSLSKITKIQKKTVRQTKKAVAKDKPLSLHNSRTVERIPTTCLSSRSTYQQLMLSLQGRSSVTEHMENESSVNRDTSSRDSLRKPTKSSTNIKKDGTEIRHHSSSCKRKSMEGYPSKSKIRVLSDVAAVSTKTKIVSRIDDNEEENQLALPYNYITIVPKVEQWHATVINYEKFAVVRSEDYIGKHLLLVYLPTVFSYGVVKDVKLLDEKSDELASENLEIVIITSDSPYAIVTWKRLNNLQSLGLPILSDFHRVVSQANNFSSYMRGFSLVNPNGEQVHLIGYSMNFAIDINNVLTEIRKFCR